MKLMFMFCNNCLNMALNSRNWLVEHHKCQCIFLEQQVETMKVIRKTHWSNGLVTDREMEFPIEQAEQYIEEQRRRVNNGPGIDRVDLIHAITGWCYMCITKPTPMPHIFMVQHAAAQMEHNMFVAMMAHGTKEELQRYCLENGMAMPSDNRIKLAKANRQMAQGLKDED